MAETDASPPRPDPAAPVARPKRPHTILGRLAQAVREQNWFAVALELVIVVVGVVIGFQVTAWGQGRADAAKEQTYLRQLAADLRQTEDAVEQMNEQMAPYDEGARRLAQAYYLPVAPPRDSVMHWAFLALHYYPMTPVMGTAEALVSTGDIGLIQDDSLRSAITAYLDQTREALTGYREWQAELIRHTGDYSSFIPMGEVFAATLSPAELDSLDRAGSWLAMVPPGVDLPVFDTAAFVKDERVRGLMLQVVVDKSNMLMYRDGFRDSAQRLREQVEVHLVE